jgi:hypothetical protein
MATEEGSSMDGRRRLGRLHFTLPSTLLYSAAGIPSASAAVVVEAASIFISSSADRTTSTGVTGTSEQTATDPSSPTGPVRTATSATASLAMPTSHESMCEGDGREMDAEDEAMEGEERLDVCEAHCTSDITTSPSSSSTGMLASSSSPPVGSKGSSTAALDPVQHAATVSDERCTGLLNGGGSNDS